MPLFIRFYSFTWKSVSSIVTGSPWLMMLVSRPCEVMMVTERSFLAVSPTPKSHDHILGTWQLTLTFNSLPSGLWSCDHHLPPSASFPNKSMWKLQAKGMEESWNPLVGCRNGFQLHSLKDSPSVHRRERKSSWDLKNRAEILKISLITVAPSKYFPSMQGEELNSKVGYVESKRGASAGRVSSPHGAEIFQQAALSLSSGILPV